MMARLHSAFSTYRYWNELERRCTEHTAKVDHDALLSDLRLARSDVDATFAAIRADGVAAVPDYWSAEKCANAREEIDRLVAEYPAAVKRFSGGSDKRMFGVEAVSNLLGDFHDDPFLRGIGELLGGLALYNFATLGARIDATGENNGSGDGWHRDAHGFQFKSIIYLSDVSEDNGPFEYLPGSHKLWRAALDSALGDLPAPPATRYEPAVIDRMVSRFGLKRRHFPAKAGTLLLVNTAGVHRGRPLRAGNRYALTNYYYHPFQIGEGRIEQFTPMMPGTAERIRAELLAGRARARRERSS